MIGDHRPVTDHGHALQQRPIGCERHFFQIAVQSRDGRRVAGLDFLHVCVCDSAFNGRTLHYEVERSAVLNHAECSSTPSCRASFPVGAARLGAAQVCRGLHTLR